MSPPSQSTSRTAYPVLAEGPGHGVVAPATAAASGAGGITILAPIMLFGMRHRLIAKTKAGDGGGGC